MAKEIVDCVNGGYTGGGLKVTMKPPRRQQSGAVLTQILSQSPGLNSRRTVKILMRVLSLTTWKSEEAWSWPSSSWRRTTAPPIAGDARNERFGTRHGIENWFVNFFFLE